MNEFNNKEFEEQKMKIIYIYIYIFFLITLSIINNSLINIICIFQINNKLHITIINTKVNQIFPTIISNFFINVPNAPPTLTRRQSHQITGLAYHRNNRNCQTNEKTKLTNKLLTSATKWIRTTTEHIAHSYNEPP
jgi:hypothetical protein